MVSHAVAVAAAAAGKALMTTEMKIKQDKALSKKLMTMQIVTIGHAYFDLLLTQWDGRGKHWVVSVKQEKVALII